MNRTGIIVIFLAISTTVALTTLSTTNTPEPHPNNSIIDNEYKINLPKGQKTVETKLFDGSQQFHFQKPTHNHGSYDCSTEEPGCIQKDLQETYLECTETYHPQVELGENCVTTNKTSQISLVTDDRNNHVTAPITEENLDITLQTENEEIKDQRFSNPWDIEHLSDDRYLITGLGGKIYDVKNGEVVRYSLDVKTESPNDEEESFYTGLRGAVKHPDFEENDIVYLQYSYDSKEIEEHKPVLSKVSKFKIDREQEEINREETIIDEIPGRLYYHGGRMRFGPDEEHLYITTGSAIYRYAQNESFLGGKILRLNPDGSIPENNPYNNSVYAKGLRNPQGIDFSPKSSELTIAQHGPWRRDNIAKIDKGTNLEWPNHCEKSNPEAELGEVLFCTQTWTLAPSGLTYIKDEDHRWHEDLFIAGLRGNHLHRIEITDGVVQGNEVFWFNGMENKKYEEDLNRIRDVEYRNGTLWVLHNNAYMTKITPK